MDSRQLPVAVPAPPAPIALRNAPRRCLALAVRYVALRVSQLAASVVRARSKRPPTEIVPFNRATRDRILPRLLDDVEHALAVVAAPPDIDEEEIADACRRIAENTLRTSEVDRVPVYDALWQCCDTAVALAW